MLQIQYSRTAQAVGICMLLCFRIWPGDDGWYQWLGMVEDAEVVLSWHKSKEEGITLEILRGQQWPRDL